jgi:hypothetical protein
VKQVKVITRSFVENVPKRKAVFTGPVLEARKKAAYRARKYRGVSHIYNIKSGALLHIYSYDPDADTVNVSVCKHYTRFNHE